MLAATPVHAFDKTQMVSPGNEVIDCTDDVLPMWEQVRAGDVAALGELAISVGYYGVKLPGMQDDLMAIARPVTILALNALAAGHPREYKGVDLMLTAKNFFVFAWREKLQKCMLPSNITVQSCATRVIDEGYVPSLQAFISEVDAEVGAGAWIAHCNRRHSFLR